MQRYAYELVNVFAETHFGGNPLAVFTQADGLSTPQMQLIARQMNLSEVVFLHQATEKSAVAKLRIFTPEYEMPFAGHPTVGAAFVLRNLLTLGDHFQLQTNAGLVAIQAKQDEITFRLDKGEVENAPLSKQDCADILGLPLEQIASAPSWVDTGVAQLLVELGSAEAVKSCRINSALFLHKSHSKTGIAQMYVWHAQHDEAKVRLFFAMGGAVLEDPGTGSAAANLGSWCIANKRTPLRWKILQGDEIGRPNRLTLNADQQHVYVGGKVIAVGRGEIFVP